MVIKMKLSWKNMILSMEKTTKVITMISDYSYTFIITGPPRKESVKVLMSGSACQEPRDKIIKHTAEIQEAVKVAYMIQEAGKVLYMIQETRKVPHMIQEAGKMLYMTQETRKEVGRGPT